MQKFNNKTAEGGLTLLEVLIASAIMAGGMILVANTWSGNIIRMQRSHVHATMAHLLDRKMTEVRIESMNTNLASIPEEDGGDFGDDHPFFRWEMSSRPFQMPNLASAIPSNTGGGMDQNMTMLTGYLQDFFEQAIFEVTVTVFYERRTEFSHSITTYFVDHSKEFTIPGLIE